PFVLDDEQVQFWKDDGYLVVPEMLPKNKIAELLQCVHESAEAIATGGPGAKRQEFSKWEKGCVNPNGRVIAALTERAFQSNTRPLQHIQRLGCGVHRVLPPFRRAIMSAQHTEIAKSLGYTDPRVVQSLVVVKAAEVGRRVVPHQDGCTSFTDPPSCTTFWYALEDADANNGCLAVVPGSHRVAPIIRRCRGDEKGMPEFEALKEPIFADIHGVSADAPTPEKNDKGDFVYKELEVEAGTLVLMHGNLMHTSAANRSEKSRVAFNFGVVEGGLEWKEDNYLQPYEG
ncbi:phytanoyl-CoA dioxygenase, partial [Ophiobolus disseminans]